jgi:hypothetical protein
MGTYTPTEYQMVNRKRADRLKKVQRKTPIKAAKYMAAKARELKPGIHSIQVVRRKNEVRISGTNPRNGFPFVHWVNQSEGYEVLQAGRYTDWKGRPMVSINGNWVHVKGGHMIYGSAPSGWDWKGTPRFATIARNSARQFFRNTMIRDTRKAINLTG